MNTLNAIVTKIFDMVMGLFGWLGPVWILILGSGVFGVLALLVFKHISSQKSIKATKDRIKGHLIEIRLYQDDLGVVAKSIGKILLRNVQYLFFNFGPIIPLALPFAFILAQFVVRFAYAPIPVEDPAAEFLAGQGTTIEIRLDEDRAEEIRGLEVELPGGLRAVSPVVRIPGDGRAYVEVVGAEAGEWDILMRLADGSTATKRVVTGEKPAALMQPLRVSSPFSAVLYPAEDTFDGDSAFDTVTFAYPDRDLGWLPGGEFGVLLTFLVASMLFGAAALKPLGVQI